MDANTQRIVNDLEETVRYINGAISMLEPLCIEPQSPTASRRGNDNGASRGLPPAGE